MSPKRVKVAKSFIPPSVEETILFGTTLGSTRIEVVRGDARTFKAEAIVNAANSALRGGGGIDGQIHAAAGHDLRNELESAYPDGGQEGCAYATGSHEMSNCEHIIHTVGPDYRKAKYEEDADRVLATAYYNSLSEASRVGATSIAFPTISTGIFQAPRDRACRIALETIRDYPEPLRNGFSRIVFLMFGDDSEDEKQYTAQFFDIFDPDEEGEGEEEQDAEGDEDVDYSRAGHAAESKIRGTSSKDKSKPGKSQPNDKSTKSRDTSSTSTSQTADTGSKRKRSNAEADQSTSQGIGDQDDEGNKSRKKKSVKDKKGGKGGGKKGGRPSQDPDEPPRKKRRCTGKTSKNKRCKKTFVPPCTTSPEATRCYLHWGT